MDTIPELGNSLDPTSFISSLNDQDKVENTAEQVHGTRSSNLATGVSDLGVVCAQESVREKTLMRAAATSTNHINSGLENIDEMDQIHTAVEEILDRLAVFRIEYMTRTIQDREWEAFLALLQGSTPDLDIEDFQEIDTPLEVRNTSMSMASAHIKQTRKTHALLTKSTRRQAQIEGRADKATGDPEAFGVKPATGSWKIEELSSDDLKCAGRGDTLTTWDSMRDRPSGMNENQRQLLRRGAYLQGGEDLVLAIEAPSPHNTGGWNLSGATYPKSMVVSGDKLSAVDSGTTLTIITGEDGKYLCGFDKSATVKIMGFNGSITSSSGKGCAVGFAETRNGTTIGLKIPNAHVVQGAPNDLLSVSGMVAIGYQFHFQKPVSYVVTPEKEVLNLIEQNGLYWLRWKQTNELSLATSKLHTMTEARAGAMAPTLGHLSTGAVDGTADILLNGGEEFAGDGTIGQRSENELNVTCERDDCYSCNAATRVRESSVSLDLLHRRLGHFNLDSIENMVRNKSLDMRLSDKQRHVCPVCKAHKITRRSVPSTRDAEPITEHPFERVWSDVKGKITQTSMATDILLRLRVNSRGGRTYTS